MSAQLAILTPDPEGGFNVIDSRDGEALAWRGDPISAESLCAELNLTYTPSMTWPSHDSLVHEVVCLRIGGEAIKPLEAEIAHGHLDCKAPAFVPWGPGWDHLYSEHESPGPSWRRRA